MVYPSRDLAALRADHTLSVCTALQPIGYLGLLGLSGCQELWCAGSPSVATNPQASASVEYARLRSFQAGSRRAAYAPPLRPTPSCAHLVTGARPFSPLVGHRGGLIASNDARVRGRTHLIRDPMPSGLGFTAEISPDLTRRIPRCASPRPECVRVDRAHYALIVTMECGDDIRHRVRPLEARPCGWDPCPWSSLLAFLVRRRPPE
jgi:hypothetical protein